MLFHFFQVSLLHNAVHLIFGVVGLMMARTVNGARAYLVGGGLIYLALFGYGYLIEQDSPANVIPVNTADNWLHLVFGADMVLLGAATGCPGV